MASGAPMPADAPVIVLLAAGEASRFGGPKQLALLDGVPMVRRMAQTALATGHPLMVIGGAYAAEVEAALHDMPLAWLWHPRWAQGLGSSIAFAVAHLPQNYPHTSAVLLCLADQPLVDAALLQQLLDHHRRHPDRMIATDYGPRLGPPVVFPRGDFAELLALDGTEGAQTLLRRQPARVLTIHAPQAAFDVDRPEDQQRLQIRLDQRREPR